MSNRFTYVKGSSEYTETVVPVVIAGLLAAALMHFTHLPWFAAFGAAFLFYKGWTQWYYSDLRQADKYYRSYDFRKSLEHAQKFVSQHPKTSRGYLFTAVAYLGLGEPERVIEECDKAIALGNPQMANRALSHRAGAYILLEQPEKALSDATERLRFVPSDAFARSALASAYLRLHKYEQAVQESDRLILQNGKYAYSASIYRAFANLRMHKLDLAQQQCDEIGKQLARNFTPGNVANVNHLKGSLLVAQDKFEEAISAYSAVIECGAKPQLALISRGYCLVRLAKFELAVKDFEMVETWKVSPFIRALLLSNRARLKILEGESAAAIDLARESFESFETAPTVMAIYGLILTRNNDLELAKSVLDSAVALNPYCAESFAFRAELHEKLNEHEKAMQDKSIADKFGYHNYL